jgi:hypothetical protein
LIQKFALAGRMRHFRLMTDSDFIPLEQLVSARDLPPEKQAECLLSVIDAMIECLYSPPDKPVDAALSTSDARQVFRQCSESLCRPLSKDETRELLELTIIGLCEKLTGHAADDDAD